MAAAAALPRRISWRHNPGKTPCGHKLTVTSPKMIRFKKNFHQFGTFMLSFPTMYLTRVFDNFFKIPILSGVPAYAGVRSRRRPSKKNFSSKCPEMNFRKSYKSWGPYHIPFTSSGVQCTPGGHFDPPSPGRVKGRYWPKMTIFGQIGCIKWARWIPVGGRKFSKLARKVSWVLFLPSKSVNSV